VHCFSLASPHLPSRGCSQARSITPLTTSDLGRLHRTHLRNPRRARLNLADGTDLIRRIPRDADIVASFKSELDVADLEDLAAALLGVLAGCLEDLVYEVVGDLEDGLDNASQRNSYM
jgi:hypothetical protein